jgi:hypothetical protein
MIADQRKYSIMVYGFHLPSAVRFFLGALFPFCFNL